MQIKTTALAITAAAALLAGYGLGANVSAADASSAAQAERTALWEQGTAAGYNAAIEGLYNGTLQVCEEDEAYVIIPVDIAASNPALLPNHFACVVIDEITW